MIEDLQILIYKTNLSKRFWASFIDYTLVFALTYLYIDTFEIENEEGVKAVNGVMVFPILIVWFFYFIVLEVLYGGTLCHLALKLKVLTIDGREIGFSQSLKRHLVDPIDFFFFGFPAIIAIKNSDKHQRLGDMLAKTVVIDITDKQQYKNHSIK